VLAVAMRGSNKEAGRLAPFARVVTSAFCIRRCSAGNPSTEDFFTEEYALNHLIHNYPSPSIAFMDGMVMGGGMGFSQGATRCAW
jgi:enoyl-CoA hydratase/carnithine racemase